jgi:phosphate transport system protein
MGEKSGVSNPRAKLDQDLDRLRDDILRMGSMVDNAIVRAMEALVEQDTVLAQEVIDGDEAVNAMRFQVEEHCLSLIATQQPAAGDLRAIVAAMNIVSDLERMGDHAAGIAKSVLRGEDDPKLDVPTDITRMAKSVREMLLMAFDAYRNQDLALAHKVAARDDEIDEQYRKLFRDLLQTMAEKPIKSGSGIRLQFASHNLERIADRATNLVERVIFQHSGEMQELNPEPGETGFN